MRTFVMEVVDFELEVIDITVAIGFSFYSLDRVIYSLHHRGGNGEEKIVEDTIGMAAKLPGKTSQQLNAGAESLVNPIIEMSFSLVAITQFPQLSQFFFEDISDRKRSVDRQRQLQFFLGRSG